MEKVEIKKLLKIFKQFTCGEFSDTEINVLLEAQIIIEKKLSGVNRICVRCEKVDGEGRTEIMQGYEICCQCMHENEQRRKR